MKCKCGFIGKPIDFTTTNKSADGSRAVCKTCRRIASVEGRKKKKAKNSELPFFDLMPSLLEIKNKARIGVLVMNNFVDRDSRLKKGFYNINIGNVGLTAILNELKEPYEHCPPEAINQFDYVLVSLTSVLDVENLIYNLEVYAPQERKCKVIIGGFGVINIKLIVSYIDIAVFGRAEGQINEILAGYKYPNVWRKASDPDVTGQYVIRQARYLVGNERSVGCRNKCLYCQYTYVRVPLDKAVKYDPGMTIQETDWNGLDITKAGRYNTAWDGWSDGTRRMVHKPVTNATIEKKLMGIDVEGTVNMKVYQIVGYPWESMESVEHDIEQTTAMLCRIDKQMKGKVNISFLCTPFGPEPLTPMQHESANVETQWRDLGGRVLLKGEHIRAYISPFISGSFLLLKRVIINRAETKDIGLFKRIAFSRELLKLPDSLRVKWLLKHEAIERAIFDEIKAGGVVSYLSIERHIPYQESLL